MCLNKQEKVNNNSLMRASSRPSRASSERIASSRRAHARRASRRATFDAPSRHLAHYSTRTISRIFLSIRDHAHRARIDAPSRREHAHTAAR